MNNTQRIKIFPPGVFSQCPSWRPTPNYVCFTGRKMYGYLGLPPAPHHCITNRFSSSRANWLVVLRKLLYPSISQFYLCRLEFENSTYTTDCNEFHLIAPHLLTVGGIQLYCRSIKFFPLPFIEWSRRVPGQDDVAVSWNHRIPESVVALRSVLWTSQQTGRHGWAGASYSTTQYTPYKTKAVKMKRRNRPIPQWKLPRRQRKPTLRSHAASMEPHNVPTRHAEIESHVSVVTLKLSTKPIF